MSSSRLLLLIEFDPHQDRLVRRRPPARALLEREGPRLFLRAGRGARRRSRPSRPSRAPSGRPRSACRRSPCAHGGRRRSSGRSSRSARAAVRARPRLSRSRSLRSPGAARRSESTTTRSSAYASIAALSAACPSTLCQVERRHVEVDEALVVLGADAEAAQAPVCLIEQVLEVEDPDPAALTGRTQERTPESHCCPQPEREQALTDLRVRDHERQVAPGEPAAPEPGRLGTGPAGSSASASGSSSGAATGISAPNSGSPSVHPRRTPLPPRHELVVRNRRREGRAHAASRASRSSSSMTAARMSAARSCSESANASSARIRRASRVTRRPPRGRRSPQPGARGRAALEVQDRRRSIVKGRRAKRQQCPTCALLGALAAAALALGAARIRAAGEQQSDPAGVGVAARG